MLEPYSPSVYVESPPSNDLPLQIDNRIAIDMSDDQKQRVIYLRPGDTVFLEADNHLIKVLAEETKSSGAMGAPQGEQSGEIQVESSIQQFTTDTGTTSGALKHDEDTEDDEDDEDAPVATPANDEDVTPTTSHLAVKETPSGHLRRNNHVISAATDMNDAQHAIEGTNDPDSSTPAARAGAQKSERESTQPEDDAESQFVFESSKGQKTYGRTPKQKSHGAVEREILESSEPHDIAPKSPGVESAALELRHGEARSSPPKRKHSMTNEDEYDDAIPASTAPPVKRSRGRPTNASKAANTPSVKTPAPAKTGRPRGRPSTTSKAASKAEDAAEPPSSSGKLKRPSRKSDAHKEQEDEDSDRAETVAVKPRRRNKVSPDLDPHPSPTPQSPGTPLTGKAPTKILLSNSKFADDKKAKAWLSKHGATIGEVVPGKRSNFICVVGIGELATTAKVLRSLALGKKVVTDQWFEKSMKEDCLLDLDTYVHDDLAETAGINRGKLLEGRTLFITAAQTKAYGSAIDDIKELATAMGAWKVESGSSKKGSMTEASTILLGGDGNDRDASNLVKEEGRTVYQKALLTQSVIRGELLVDEEELKWRPTPTTGKKGKK